jgi:hypothetical protein
LAGNSFCEIASFEIQKGKKAPPGRESGMKQNETQTISLTNVPGKNLFLRPGSTENLLLFDDNLGEKRSQGFCRFFDEPEPIPPITVA